MYNRKILSLLIVAALTGCNSDDPVLPNIQEPVLPEIEDPTMPGPDGLPNIGVDDPIITGEFSLDSHLVFGPSVTCNNEPANAFEFSQNDVVICEFDGTTLASFSDVFGQLVDRSAEAPVRHRLTLSDADEFLGNPQMADNALTLIKAVAPSHNNQINLDFTTSQSKLNFIATYTNDLDMDPVEFKKILEEKPTEENLADKQPSTHVPDIKPEVSPGTSTDLNAGFVSANAEEAYQYKPKDIILSKATLTDSNNRPVVGLSYFSSSSRGKTNETGEFEFVWGEAISFGIETFELGSVRGNQTQFKLTDLGEDRRGRNVESLIKRYADDNGTTLEINKKTFDVFAQYPNVINEAISLSLTDKDTVLELGDGQTATVVAEFDNQFKHGLAADIDQAICGDVCTSTRLFNDFQQPRIASDDLTNIQSDINKLWGINAAEAEGWKPVRKFHTFHDSTWFYGSSGYARGQAAVNISNRAIPVLMARNDNNYWLAFNEKKAWDERNLAYITEAPSIERPDLVGKNTATFGLPFVSVGELGKGKIMVLGNARYNSVLVCPNAYSWGGNSSCALPNNKKDSDDMKNFFNNTIRYLTNRVDNETINVGTNIPHVYFTIPGFWTGKKADYVISDEFNVTTQQVDTFDGIDPIATPLLILNGFDYSYETSNDYLPPHTANLNSPKLSKYDVNALVDYVSRGGNILVMETISSTNDAGELGRLLDAAGIAFGMGGSVVPSGNGPGDGYPDRVRSQREFGHWIIERYNAETGETGEQPKLPYTIEQDGSVSWDYITENKPDDKPNLQVATYQTETPEGEFQSHKAYIVQEDHFQKDEHNKWVLDINGDPVVNAESLQTAKNKLLDQFLVNGVRTYQECVISDYHYEVNCLEFRPGNDIPVTGGMYRPAYTKLTLGSEEAKAMIKAADLGTNIERLYQHEKYFRSEGKQGERLTSVDLNRIYNNMTVWLWNNLDYRFESNQEDELGFERFTEFLNCYTSNTAGGNTSCPDTLGNELVKLNMVYGVDAGEYSGQMNPSYPLNYMEKPLTRLMLGRSFWDYNVNVDIRQFPGKPTGSTGGTSLTFNMENNTAAYYAGNRQATGQWAVAHQPFTVSVSGNTSPVTVTVALHDDLTGREKHELALMRPPRMQMSFTVNGGSDTFTVPYGGLIYVQGGHSNAVTVNISGTVNAPLYDSVKGWVNPQNSPAPIGDVVSDTFIYTAPKANLNVENITGNVTQFADDLDQFSADLNDFYARDEGIEGRVNRASTHPTISNNRHSFVNDVAISIGSAHSGYPVMNSAFNPNSNNVNTVPLNDWLLWHEVGHNAAEAPLTVEGATEVANNVVGLYMQQKYLGKMSRVERDIRIAPDFVKAENGHAWATGGAGERLLMFAQLKEWAETEFDISRWYSNEVPSFYSSGTGMNGFNFYTLMHRLTRNASEEGLLLNGENQCFGQGLSKSDSLMLCASYATQTDLTDFFTAWNPGVVANILPGVSEPQYTGGISQAGRDAVTSLNLPQPVRDPLSIDSVTVVLGASMK